MPAVLHQYPGRLVPSGPGAAVTVDVGTRLMFHAAGDDEASVPLRTFMAMFTLRREPGRDLNAGGLPIPAGL